VLRVRNSAPGEDVSELSPGQGSSSRAELLSILRRYGVAVLCVLVAFAIRYWLSPVLGEELPFMLFLAASLIAAWYGGAVAGIVALLLGLLLASHFFLPLKNPPRMPYSEELLQFIRYLFTASLGIVLIEVLHRDRRRTRAALNEVQREIERRQRTEAALREAQTQLRQHADELERRVAERTARLTATIESLRDLLYHIAHNLRAPLRAMEGYSTVLATECEAGLGPSSQEYLRHISEAAQRMDQLIHDLLEYGRLGHMDVALTKVSLQRIVKQVLAQLAFEIQTQKAEVSVLGPLPEVRAHAEILVQILTNLLENALKFVPPGVRPRIRIRAEMRPGTAHPPSSTLASVVRLWIEDNGIGIDPQYHERIFRVFGSLYPGRGIEGTGIGLAIVRQGVQRLGGQVGVESQLGAGSRFWVDLPNCQQSLTEL
jgi:signal transduction histidine kinase